MFHFEEHHAPRNPAGEADRRSSRRYGARARTTLIRESDQLRQGIVGSLHDLSVMGLGMLIDDEESLPEIGEGVQVRLRNDVQRVDREVGGIVRHVTQVVDGSYLVGIELTTRLTPLEVSLLKMPIELNDDGFWM
ncbi:MAG: PilZ domain-containing protein [Planctomycetaceae bacterium]